MKRRELSGICERAALYQLADLIAFDFETGTTYLIECKKTVKKKWCPSAREKRQFLNLWATYLSLPKKISASDFKIIYEIKEAGIKRILEIVQVRRRYFPRVLSDGFL